MGKLRFLRLFVIVLGLFGLVVLGSSQGYARIGASKSVRLPEAKKKVVQVTAEEEALIASRRLAGARGVAGGGQNVELVEEVLWPIAPQAYDGFNGEVQEPFAPSEPEKKKIRIQVAKRKALAKKKALIAKRRAAKIKRALASKKARNRRALSKKRKRTSKRVVKKGASKRHPKKGRAKLKASRKKNAVKRIKRRTASSKRSTKRPVKKPAAKSAPKKTIKK